MSEAPVIRAARTDEADALARFAARLFRETYTPVCRAEDVDAYAATFTRDAQEAELRDPAGATLIAEVDGELAGYARLHRGNTPHDVPGTRPLFASSLTNSSAASMLPLRVMLVCA